MKGSIVSLAMVSALVLVAVLMGGVTLWKMSVNKGEIALVTRYEAQFNVVETGLFKMRSTIRNIHACNNEWADKFIKVVAMQAQGRSRVSPETAGATTAAGAAVLAGGLGINVSRESEALGLPQDLYMKLANAIEGQLADFTRQQNILTDVWREHTAYCKDPYHNWLGLSLSNKVKKMPEMITSDETKYAIEKKSIDEKMF